MTGGSRYLARKEQGRHLVIYYTALYYISLCTNKLKVAAGFGYRCWICVLARLWLFLGVFFKA